MFETLEANTHVASPALDRLLKTIIALSRPIAFIGVIGMLIVSGVTILDILLRWLVGGGIMALNEIVAMIFAVTVTACLPFGIAKDINLKLDLLENWILGRLACWLRLIGAAALLLFLVLLTYWVAEFARILSSQGRTTLILNWPQAPFIYAIAALLALSVLIQLVVTLNRAASAFWYLAGPDEPQSSPAAWKFVIVIGASVLALIGYGIADFATYERFAASNPGATIAIICGVLWLLLMILMPLAAVMGLLGIVGAAMFIGYLPSLNAFATEITGFLTNSQVAVLPLFLMMGSFASVAGIAEDVYALAHACLSRMRGGLAMATIGGCAGFGAMTGSTVATAASIGRVALPEMRAHGYSPSLATGCIAAGGTLGNLVPPGSGPLVIFALLTEASIGQLFIASVIPSLLAVAAYLVTIWLYVRIVPSSAPEPAKAAPGQVRAALRRCGPVSILFVVVLGGIYAGIFTSTEAAAVGAVGAFLIALLRGKLKLQDFWDVMAETTMTTALVYPLIFGALSFAFFTGISGFTESSAKFVADLGWPPLALVSLLLVVFLILGTFMDSYAIMIITVPIVTTLVTGAGYDLIWWGILNLFVVEIGGISPPFGLTMYVLKAISDVPIAAIFRGVAPFCIAAVAVTILLMVFPEITLWLPSMMMR